MKYTLYLYQEKYCEDSDFSLLGIKCFSQMATVLFPELNSASGKTDARGRQGNRALNPRPGQRALSL